MQVNPGELNKKIKICKIGETDSRGFGGELEVVKKTWAKVTRKTGKEKEAAGTEINEAVTRFLIRYTKTAIDTTMVVAYKGKEYDIEDVNDIGEQQKYLELFCKVRE